MSAELTIILVSASITLLLLIFAVDWRYFRDWVVVYLFKGLLGLIWGAVVSQRHIEYPVRLLADYFQSNILFELGVLPVLCILYNQSTRAKGPWPSLYYAVLYSAAITALEYLLEIYTLLINYIDWHWYTSLYTLTITFLLSRIFIACYRRGCDYFSRSGKSGSLR